MDIYYIYTLIDPRNNLPFYVGKGSGDRKDFHVRSVNHANADNPMKLNLIKKIISEGLSVQIEVVSDNLNETTAFENEKKLIRQYGRRNNNTGILTNMSDGGAGNAGRVYNPEHGAKISQALTGKKRPDVAYRNQQKNKEMWETRKAEGWTHSDDVKARLSEQSKLRKHSNETKAKISEANSKRIVSEETKAKISAARKASKGNQTRSEETKAKMREAWRKRKGLF